jgi:Ner family transcriptional regulator
MKIVMKNSPSRPKNLADEPSEEIAEEDWHPARIKMELEMRGLTLAEISRRHGYDATAAGKALKTSWPSMESLIAEALGMPPQAIWPSRYSPEGISLKYQSRRKARGSK